MKSSKGSNPENQGRLFLKFAIPSLSISTPRRVTAPILSPAPFAHHLGDGSAGQPGIQAAERLGERWSDSALTGSSSIWGPRLPGGGGGGGMTGDVNNTQSRDQAGGTFYIPQTCSGAGEQSRCWEANRRVTEKRGGGGGRESGGWQRDGEVGRGMDLGVNSLPHGNPGFSIS